MNKLVGIGSIRCSMQSLLNANRKTMTTAALLQLGCFPAVLESATGIQAVPRYNFADDLCLNRRAMGDGSPPLTGPAVGVRRSPRSTARPFTAAALLKWLILLAQIIPASAWIRSCRPLRWHAAVVRCAADTISTIPDAPTVIPPPRLPLGDRMKIYENQHVTKVPKDKPYILRLDGRSFSKLIPLKKPFDSLFVLAMVRTCEDLMTEFMPATIYTHSDEVTLIFNAIPASPGGEHWFDGRTNKLLSVIPGKASVRFSLHLAQLINQHKEQYETIFVDKVNDFQQVFDGRLMTFEDSSEIVNHQIWRSVLDCERNAIQSFAYHHFTPEDTHKKSTKELIEMLREKGVRWEDVPLHLKHGIHIKRIETEPGRRDRKMEARCFKIRFSEDMLLQLLSKYWNDESLKETNPEAAVFRLQDNE